jgi:hypothetical protein
MQLELLSGDFLFLTTLRLILLLESFDLYLDKQTQ